MRTDPRFSRGSPSRCLTGAGRRTSAGLLPARKRSTTGPPRGGEARSRTTSGRLAGVVGRAAPRWAGPGSDRRRPAAPGGRRRARRPGSVRSRSAAMQRLALHQRPAAGVHEDGGGLHHGQLLAAEEAARLRRSAARAGSPRRPGVRISSLVGAAGLRWLRMRALVAAGAPGRARPCRCAAAGSEHAPPIVPMPNTPSVLPRHWVSISRGQRARRASPRSMVGICRATVEHQGEACSATAKALTPGRVADGEPRACRRRARSMLSVPVPHTETILRSGQATKTPSLKRACARMLMATAGVADAADQLWPRSRRRAR